MTSTKGQLEVQIGEETTWGTAVTPTVKLMGVTDASIEPGYEAEKVPELRGTVIQNYHSSMKRMWGEATVEGVLNYEDLLYFLSMLFAEPTPTGTDPYTWNFDGPTGDPVSSPRIHTLVIGSAAGVIGMAGATLNELEINFEEGEDVTYTASFIGDKPASDALAALSDRDVNIVKSSHLSPFVDALAGTMGNTALSSPYFSGSLMINAGRQLKYGMGNLTPSGYYEDIWSGSLSMMLEVDTTSKALRDAVLAATADAAGRLVRNQFSDGTRTAQFDFAGTFAAAPEHYSDHEEILTMDFELEDHYDSTFGNWFKAQVINSVASLS